MRRSPVGGAFHSLPTELIRVSPYCIHRILIPGYSAIARITSWPCGVLHATRTTRQPLFSIPVGVVPYSPGVEHGRLHIHTVHVYPNDRWDASRQDNARSE